jgi:hypothetical protein
MDRVPTLNESAALARWFAWRAASRLLPLLAFFFAAIVLCILAASCGSSDSARAARDAATAKLVSDVAVAVSHPPPVTPEEHATIESDVSALIHPSDGLAPWLSTTLTIAGAVVTSFLGVNTYRNATSTARTAVDLVKINTSPDSGKGASGSGTT